MSDLRPFTVYLPQDEAALLEREALEAGRAGVSAQVRYALGRRRAGGKPWTANDAEPIRFVVDEEFEKALARLADLDTITVSEASRALVQLKADVGAQLIVALGLASAE